MPTILLSDPPPSYSPSKTPPTVPPRSREASEASSNGSGIVSSPSVQLGIMSSQQATPTASSELRQLARGRSLRLCMANICDAILTGPTSRSEGTYAQNARRTRRARQRSVIDPLGPPSLTTVRKSLGPPVRQERRRSEAGLHTIRLRTSDASAQMPLLQGSISHRNSLEAEMNVNPEDQDVLARALELLSLSPQPSTSNRLNRRPTLRTWTIRRLDLPETTKRVLSALATSAFTPAQLSIARKIQRFIHDNPNTPIPPEFVTKEIAEVYEGYGWCLIGKCGLERTSYKLSRSATTHNVTDEELEGDRTRKSIKDLCGHIRDRHFEQMPFQCHLCPVSYITQHGLNRHWWTHQLGEFACPVCGEILIGDAPLQKQKHRHLKDSKSTIMTRLLRLLARAVSLKLK